MGHLSSTSVIEEVNCLIVKDILLQILEMSSLQNPRVQDKGVYLNLTVVIQCNQSIFSPSNSNIHLHKGSDAL